MSKFAKTCTGIQGRGSPKDRFYTPPSVVLKAIGAIKTQPGDIWYEPFKGAGAYYDQFPVDVADRRWSEIDLGRDAFTTDLKCDIIATNPPYSLLNESFELFARLSPRVVSVIIGVQNITRKRLNIMDQAGYHVVSMHWCDIKGWFGGSFIITFEKKEVGSAPCCTFDLDVIKKPCGGSYKDATDKS